MRCRSRVLLSCRSGISYLAYTLRGDKVHVPTNPDTQVCLQHITMKVVSLANDDPFVDPVRPESAERPAEGSTLIAGRTASLTLATDSLIVLGRDRLRKARL